MYDSYSILVLSGCFNPTSRMLIDAIVEIATLRMVVVSFDITMVIIKKTNVCILFKTQQISLDNM